jgi:hypothetical protein
MKGGGDVCQVQLGEAAHCLVGGQRLHGHTALLELSDRVGIGPHAAVGAGARRPGARELVQDLGKVVKDERVAVLAPPVPHHPVGQRNEVPAPWRPSTTIRPNS